jgi:hypothetical protein
MSGSIPTSLKPAGIAHEAVLKKHCMLKELAKIMYGGPQSVQINFLPRRDSPMG